MKSLGPGEVRTLLAVALGTPYHTLFFTAIYTGLRRSELLGLRWCDLDLDLATLSVVQTLHRLRTGECIISPPKSRSGRRPVSLPPSLAVLLRDHQSVYEATRAMLGIMPSSTDLVFSHPDGSPLRPDTVSRAFKQMATAAGISGVRFHDLRHTHATLMLRQGIHPKIVSERLGHSSVSVTLDTYSHVLPGLQEAAVRRFEEALGIAPTESQGLAAR
jgi:integrase